MNYLLRTTSPGRSEISSLFDSGLREAFRHSLVHQTCLGHRLHFLVRLELQEASNFAAAAFLGSCNSTCTLIAALLKYQQPLRHSFTVHQLTLLEEMQLNYSSHSFVTMQTLSLAMAMFTY